MIDELKGIRKEEAAHYSRHYPGILRWGLSKTANNVIQDSRFPDED
jgi:hypothetical protein